MAQLQEAISSISSLRVLDLTGNNLGLEGAKHLGEKEFACEAEM